jgi:hypothetical protein
VGNSWATRAQASLHTCRVLLSPGLPLLYKVARHEEVLPGRRVLLRPHFIWESTRLLPLHMACKAIEPSQVNRLRVTPTDTSYPDLELPPNHIRLLDLDAAPGGNHAAPLTGSLRIEQLTNLSTYNTLSYQWAPKESEDATIHCLPHNIELHITTNCEQALRSIRREFALAGPVTIWVDAVCINQNDKKEKESQIPLMGKIYSQAETGYIWLEGDNEHCRLAVDELRLRSVIRKRLPLAYLAAESGERSRLELDRLRHRRLDDVSGKQ